MADNDNGAGVGAVLLSFLAGAAVGAGVALLVAPKTGGELRGKIRSITDDAIDKIKSTIEDGREMINEKKSIFTSAIEAGKEAIEREKERLKNA